MPNLADSTIVYLNNFAGEGLGGGEVLMFHVIEAAQEADMRVHLLCQPGGEVEQRGKELGLRVTPYDLSSPNMWRTTSRVRKYLLRYAADLVHSNGYLTNLLARRSAVGTDTCVVNSVLCEPQSARAAGASAATQALRDGADRLTLGWADLTIAVSKKVASDLEDLGANPESLLVIPNAVDSAAVRADAEANPREDLAGEGALVGTVARLEPVKAVRDFLRMAALVEGHRPGTRFVVAGTGPEESELRELTDSLGLADAVTFLGSVPSAAGVLDACDVVVLTSRSEGLPTVPLEAMALGKPMVATAVGGTPEVVRDEETGLLAPSGNVVALAEAVERLLADPSAAAALGAMGRQVVEREFSVSLMKQAHLAAYRSLLNS